MPLAPAVDRAIGKIMTAGVSALRHLKWWLGRAQEILRRPQHPCAVLIWTMLASCCQGREDARARSALRNFSHRRQSFGQSTHACGDDAGLPQEAHTSRSSKLKPDSQSVFEGRRCGKGKKDGLALAAVLPLRRPTC